MTDQDFDAIVGRSRREYREAKKQLAALKASAAELSQLADKITVALMNPSRIKFFDGLPTFPATRGKEPIVLTDAMFEKLTAANIKQIAQDTKNLENRLDALRKQLAELDEDPEKLSSNY